MRGMSFVEYVRVPDPATLELFTVPGLFLLVLCLALLAGLRWHAALTVTALVLAICVMGFAARSGVLSSATTIGTAVAAILLIAFWKLRSRKTQA